MLDAMQAAFEHRQKLVRLADQHGWDVAAVYDGQELASGSTAAEREADARRIAKAIKEAERRRKPTSGPIFRQPAPSQPSSWKGTQRTSGSSTKGGFAGSCNTCGEQGHKSFKCPRAAKKKSKGGAQ